MIVIGVDHHKSTHNATAVDPATNTDRVVALDRSHPGRVPAPSAAATGGGPSRTPTVSADTSPAG